MNITESNPEVRSSDSTTTTIEREKPENPELNPNSEPETSNSLLTKLRTIHHTITTHKTTIRTNEAWELAVALPINVACQYTSWVAQKPARTLTVLTVITVAAWLTR